MATRIGLFDFDDTLVSTKGKVPRSTWWLLERLVREGAVLGIVSNNDLLIPVATSLGLSRYIPVAHMHIRSAANEDRPAMIQRWLDAHVNTQHGAFVHYYDDRVDTVERVNHHHSFHAGGTEVVVVATHVPRVDLLFQTCVL